MCFSRQLNDFQIVTCCNYSAGLFPKILSVYKLKFFNTIVSTNTGVYDYVECESMIVIIVLGLVIGLLSILN